MVGVPSTEVHSSFETLGDSQLVQLPEAAIVQHGTGVVHEPQGLAFGQYAELEVGAAVQAVPQSRWAG
jgi:hypothetical protein